MANETLKIKYTDEIVRSDWKTLDDVSQVYSDREMFEMIQRYLDAQKHAITYRQKAQVKQKLMKERLAELEARVAELDEEGEA
jgi:hypothetical protein